MRVLMLLLFLSGCSATTGVTTHKNELHALIEKGDKCIIQFKHDSQKYKDIKTDFSCNQVKYFNDN
ncbi:MAG: hypothetical protein FWE18_06825 [Alphaproteobacteria bacterium]|nr:hypothetical protein [Alphaproteobacteria bacterium]